MAQLVRFPSNGYYVYVNSPGINSIYADILQATDTRNRIIEVDAGTVSGGEQQLATRRVDDATVAIHKALEDLETAVGNGQGVFNQSSFETTSMLVWKATA